ncbi:NAD-dependent epimerase/dehydratase family protein [Parasedimentitalea huanghaiensis]|uniref:NAD-dependent epimerase/dehydratase family protein n=1 Tax=Parasedimentitalea huanghaiensis TaxID=2682100 RepID=A0A6L6WIW6_9RHOB|nr:NAD-dependent epimerase/dehydratase family protein [Zongyanglinia huanghaiensis]MVO16909.1 NAD-dependent epimerase/dehydratase family protein [Zongyanglinia huanghaiensis]
MKVLILGGTGTIGTAVTTELTRHGHNVIGLSRSVTSDQTLLQLGATPYRGDLRKPDHWAHLVREVDGLIQLATTFDDDMAAVDTRAITEILRRAAQRETPLRLLYTGGCWLYGATGNSVASETRPLRPIESFAWMTKNGQSLANAAQISAAILHPAMVYHQDGGVFARFIQQAQDGDPIEVWGSISTRWPLVHRDDLAVAYRMVLEDSNLTGSFNVSTEDGTSVGDIVAEISKRHSHKAGYLVRNLKHVVAKHGNWAEGPTLDQQMSAEKIRRLCGWSPRHAQFQNAVF